jgi:hypothetical protein
VSMVLVGMPEDSKPLGNKDVNGGKILQWILNTVGECELESFGSGQRPVVGACEHPNVCSCLDHLSSYLLLKMDYDPWCQFCC